MVVGFQLQTPPLGRDSRPGPPRTPRGVFPDGRGGWSATPVETTFRGGRILGRFLATGIPMLPLILVLSLAWFRGLGGASNLSTLLISIQVLALLGPAPMLVQLWRRLGHVQLHDEGIEWNRGFAPWAEVARVEAWHGLVGRQPRIGELHKQPGPMGEVIKLLVLLPPVLVTVVIVYYYLWTAMALLMPMHAYVRIELRDGRSIVLRDPTGSTLLVESLRAGVDSAAWRAEYSA